MNNTNDTDIYEVEAYNWNKKRSQTDYSVSECFCVIDLQAVCSAFLDKQIENITQKKPRCNGEGVDQEHIYIPNICEERNYPKRDTQGGDNHILGIQVYEMK